MKKGIFSLMIGAIVALSSCSKSDEPNLFELCLARRRKTIVAKLTIYPFNNSGFAARK